MKGFFRDVLAGKVREVRKWVEKRELVDLYDDYGNTSLHLAAEKGFRGVCKVLLDAGADVNQKNESVGWTAVHYAAYEGHTDVLRMLLAHGAIPNIRDKSGDTAETYAEEWQNTECIKILQEATALIQETFNNQEYTNYDSDEKTPSDSDDDDEDESSMMNWVIPPPVQPNIAINANRVNTVTNLTNTKFTKTVQNLSLDQEDKINNNKLESSSSEEDIHLSVHLVRPVKAAASTSCLPESESLPDLSTDDITETFNNKNLNSTTSVSQAEDTESEDTLVLIRRSEEIKAAKEDLCRGQSIVDRIKSSLPAKTAVDAEKVNRLDDKLPTKTDSIPEDTKEPIKGRDIQGDRERSVARAFSQAREIMARERSRTRATSQAKDATVVCGQPQLRDTAIPKELLPIADHIFNLSSATIPDDMTMSCGSVFEKFTNELDGTETEKEILIKRLKELIEVEGKQVDTDLKSKRQKLADIEESHIVCVTNLKRSYVEEEDELIRKYTEERSKLVEKHTQEEERIQKEIEKLEKELETISAPSELLKSLEPAQSLSQPPAKPGLSELEQELACCGCALVCRPPHKIYQCPEGDLICEICKKRLNICPVCKMELVGGLSRNKVLENIARKYFADK